MANHVKPAKWGQATPRFLTVYISLKKSPLTKKCSYIGFKKVIFVLSLTAMQSKHANILS